MPRTIVIETYDEFVQRHGGHPLMVDSNHWLLSDGASVKRDFLGQPIFVEPPEETLERLQARRQYHDLWLGRAEADFNQLKAALLGHLDQYHTPITWDWPQDGRYGSAPAANERYGLPDGKAALKKLRSLILERRKTIAAIDDSIDALPQTKARKRQEREQARRERQLADEQFAATQEIEAVEI